MTGPLMDVWHPVASSSDLVPRHIYQTRLEGQELAIWRDDKGVLNVWENRCPHRGVRLSIGASLGQELRCQYHGWRFASGTGACTAIPAHPGKAPPSAVKVRSWVAVEAIGLVWTSLTAATAPAGPPELPGQWLVLRALPIDRTAAAVEDVLHRMDFGNRLAVRVSVHRGGWDGLAMTGQGLQVSYFVQPVDAGRCVVRGVMDLRATPAGSELSPLDALQAADLALEQLRRRIESTDDPAAVVVGTGLSGGRTC